MVISFKNEQTYEEQTQRDLVEDLSCEKSFRGDRKQTEKSEDLVTAVLSVCYMSK